MEHLLLARGGALTEHDVVPFVATADFYNISFLDFMRTQWSSTTATALHRTHPETFNSLMQTWFFFGLYKQVLGDFFVPEQYVVTQDPPDGNVRDQPMEVLCTKKLVSALMAWSEHAVGNSDVEGSLPIFEACYERYYEDAVWIMSEPYLPTAMATSLLSAASLLFRTLARTFHQLQHLVVAVEGFKFLPSMHLDIMRRNGWCPYDVSREWESVLIESQMIMRTAVKKGLADHTECTVHHCCHTRVALEDHRLSHSHPECCCEVWSVDEAELAKILEDGELPLLMVDAEVPDSTPPSDPVRELELKLVSGQRGTPFVAISHVWADGLGNPRANALPRCQLRSLASKVRALSSNATHHFTGSTVCFWLDTICCPVGPPALNALAMSRMRNIYQDASDVLVLDKSIELMQADELNVIERAMYIATSRWTKRLWTLQEGYLARCLWFRFADLTVNVDELMLALTRFRASSPVLGYQAASDFCAGLSTFTGGLKEASTPVKPVSLQDVVMAITMRSVTVASDEPFCLSALIGGDISTPERYKGENMAKFWDICLAKTEVGRAIIFNEMPRLDIDGFRWAPASLLHDVHGLSIRQTGYWLDPSERSDIVGIAQPAQRIGSKSGDNDLPEGLLVHYPAFMLTTSNKATMRQMLLQDGQQEIAWPWMLLRHEEAGTWYIVYPEKVIGTPHHCDPLGDSDGFALILSELPTFIDQDYVFGLFVSILDTRREHRHVSSRGLCFVYKPEDEHVSLLNRLHQAPTEADQITPEMAELARRCLEQRHPAPDWPEQDDELRARQYITSMSARMKRGQYLDVAEFLEEKQSWIVD